MDASGVGMAGFVTRRFVALLSATLLVLTAALVITAPPALSAVDTTVSLADGVPNPSVHGQNVDWAVAVTEPSTPGADPTGTIDLWDTTPDPDVLLTSTTTADAAPGDGTWNATLSWSQLPAGAHVVEARFTHTDTTTHTSGTRTQTVNKSPSSVSTQTANSFSPYGEPVTFSYTVLPSPGGPGSATPTGTITLTDGGATIAGPRVLNSGSTSFSTSSLSVGTHTITGVYSGDANYDPSQQGRNHVVSMATPNRNLTSNRCCASQTNYGEGVTFTLKLTNPSNKGPADGVALPTGVVDFYRDADVLLVGNVPVASDGTASIATAGLTIDFHTIIARYRGDSNYNATENQMSHRVFASPTQTFVSSAPNPSVFGEKVTLTGDVDRMPFRSGAQAFAVPGNGPVDDIPPMTGDIRFFIDGLEVGVAPVNADGVATFSTAAMSVGRHDLSARYLGSCVSSGCFSPNKDLASGSQPEITKDHVVEAARTATATGLTSSRNPSSLFRPVTFTIPVTSASGIPTGTVGIFDGTERIGTATLDAAGLATFTSSSLALGDHSISARYDGDPTFSPSSSPVVVQTVGLGYLVTTADGQVTPFGSARDFPLNGVLGLSEGQVAAAGQGRTTALGLPKGAKLNSPIAGLFATPTGNGYYLLGGDGGIFTFGDAAFYGSTGSMKLNKPVVGVAATPTGGGYWLVASDGGIFSFGDAAFFGSTGNIKLNSPIVAMWATPTGQGYWLVAADGGIFNFGDAGFFGSMGGTKLNKPVVGMASTATGLGYWLVASDGGIFTFGDAAFLGSAGNLALRRPIVGMVATPTGNGYWLLGGDGGVFTFGDAPFLGSTGDKPLDQPVTGFGYA